jgi:uncharacterized protein YbaR (Trm112 family)
MEVGFQRLAATDPNDQGDQQCKLQSSCCARVAMLVEQFGAQYAPRGCESAKQRKAHEGFRKHATSLEPWFPIVEGISMACPTDKQKGRYELVRREDKQSIHCAMLTQTMYGEERGPNLPRNHAEDLQSSKRYGSKAINSQQVYEPREMH